MSWSELKPHKIWSIRARLPTHKDRPEANNHLFYPQTIHHWNCLPNEMKAAQTVETLHLKTPCLQALLGSLVGYPVALYPSEVLYCICWDWEKTDECMVRVCYHILMAMPSDEELGGECTPDTDVIYSGVITLSTSSIGDSWHISVSQPALSLIIHEPRWPHRIIALNFLPTPM